MATLLPPEDGFTYPTLDGLVQQVQKHAFTQGYAVVISRSKNNKKGQRRKAWLRCDRGGKAEKHSKSLDKRVTGSRLIDCPFKLTASLQYEQMAWVLRVENATHNHGPSRPGGHPSHRKNALTPAIRGEIANLTRAGCMPSQVITKLRLNEDPDQPLIKNQDIYNAKAVIRSQALGPITAQGVAQQEEEAIANAFFRPPTIRGRGLGRGRGGRGRDRGTSTTRSGPSLGYSLSYARGHETQFGVMWL